MASLARFISRRNGLLSCNSFVKRTVSNSSSTTGGNNTHFGFETVPEEEKEHRVHKVFQDVADKYDVMNDVMSGGIHRLWKDHFIRKIGPVENSRLLDVAGGTGDITFRYLQHLKNDGNEASDDKKTKVTVFDLSQAMLDVGMVRAKKNGFEKDIAWVQGNAENLPFGDNEFDVYTVAYGIRNMTHIDKVLSEAYRVLKPGGRFACLEFSRVNNYILRNLYDTYSFEVIPVMGKLIANDYKSYKYLVESIRKFPDQEEFSGMIRSAGFEGVNYENLMFGVTAIHSGYKL